MQGFAVGFKASKNLGLAVEVDCIRGKKVEAESWKYEAAWSRAYKSKALSSS